MNAKVFVSARTVSIITEQIEVLENKFPATATSKQLDRIRQLARDHQPKMRWLYKNIVNCLMVSRWYRSAHESEGMWVRYSKEGDAIKTSVEAMMEDQTPTPTSVAVDVAKLIEGVVISPFAGSSLRESVKAVCRWGGIELSKVSMSNLLENCEHLLDAYN